MTAFHGFIFNIFNMYSPEEGLIHDMTLYINRVFDDIMSNSLKIYNWNNF